MPPSRRRSPGRAVATRPVDRFMLVGIAGDRQGGRLSDRPLSARSPERRGRPGFRPGDAGRDGSSSTVGLALRREGELEALGPLAELAEEAGEPPLAVAGVPALAGPVAGASFASGVHGDQSPHLPSSGYSG